jgi:hypothetical protein
MSAPDLRVARVTKWGIAGLLIFAGVMFMRTRWSDALPVADVAVYAAAIGLGCTLLLNSWRARWLVLGVCYLFIVAAFLVPLLVFIRQPEGTSSGAVFANALKSVFMIVLGGIGYRGLSYFRSAHARREFAGSPEREERLMMERSSAVVWSAGAWTVFLGLAYFGGMTVPIGLVTTTDAHRESATREATAPVTAADGEQSVPSDAEPPPGAEPEPPPRFREVASGADIAPIGLCRAGDSWVGISYANRGGTTRPDEFGIEYNNSIWNPGSRSSFMAKLPPPGGVMSSSLGSLGSLGGEENMSNVIRLDFDPDNRIGESNERDNTPEYPISWDIFAGLPACGSSQDVER